MRFWATWWCFWAVCPDVVHFCNLTSVRLKFGRNYRKFHLAWITRPQAVQAFLHLEPHLNAQNGIEVETKENFLDVLDVFVRESMSRTKSQEFDSEWVQLTEMLSTSVFVQAVNNLCKIHRALLDPIYSEAIANVGAVAKVNGTMEEMICAFDDRIVKFFNGTIATQIKQRFKKTVPPEVFKVFQSRLGRIVPWLRL